jgi:Kinesin motor domain
MQYSTGVFEASCRQRQEASVLYGKKSIQVEALKCAFHAVRRLPSEMQVRHECHVGMLEIYNETVSDLLVPEFTNLLIREDAAQGTHVENLSSHRVNAGVVLFSLCAFDSAMIQIHVYLCGRTLMKRF